MDAAKGSDYCGEHLLHDVVRWVGLILLIETYTHNNWETLYLILAGMHGLVLWKGRGELSEWVFQPAISKHDLLVNLHEPIPAAIFVINMTNMAP